MKMRQFLVFPYPEEVGLAPSWAAKAGPGPAVLCEIVSFYRWDWERKTSSMGTGPPLVTTLGITPFHFATARP